MVKVEGQARILSFPEEETAVRWSETCPKHRADAELESSDLKVGLALFIELEWGLEELEGFIEAWSRGSSSS